MTFSPSTSREDDRLMPGKIVTVDFSAAAPIPRYDIVIGHNILSEAGTLIRLRLGTRRCIILTDTNVEPLYRARLEAVLATSGHNVVTTLTIPAGEASKDMATLQSLLDKVQASGVDRKTLLIALGGGVVGDLGGLVASLVMRGLDLIQIPTTLLAQVDSSVGGKNGIDTPYGKNIIGTFYQPRLVLADVSALDSLSEREMRAGYAEVIKYGLIQDAAFFRWCVSHGAKLLSGSHSAQIQAVSVCCKAKAKIVSEDERETGHRALLNLGHTFGHALEAITGYGTLLNHGEAVSIGMVMAFRLSVKLGLCPAQDLEELRTHLLSVGLPIKPPAFAYDIERLISLMKQDKKAENGKMALILARGIGQTFINSDVDTREVRSLWEEFLCL